MIQGLIGKKLGMTQVYDDNGKVHAITAIAAGPCTVTQIKTEDKEGYNAILFRRTYKQLMGADGLIELSHQAANYL